MIRIWSLCSSHKATIVWINISYVTCLNWCVWNMKPFYTKLEIIAIIEIAENLHEFEPVLYNKKKF